MLATPEPGLGSVAARVRLTAFLYQEVEQAKPLQLVVVVGGVLSCALLFTVTVSGVEEVWLPEASMAWATGFTDRSGIVVEPRRVWRAAVWVAPPPMRLP